MSCGIILFGTHDFNSRFIYERYGQKYSYAGLLTSSKMNGDEELYIIFLDISGIRRIKYDTFKENENNRYIEETLLIKNMNYIGVWNTLLLSYVGKKYINSEEHERNVALETKSDQTQKSSIEFVIDFLTEFNRAIFKMNASEIIMEYRKTNVYDRLYLNKYEILQSKIMEHLYSNSKIIKNNEFKDIMNEECLKQGKDIIQKASNQTIGRENINNTELIPIGYKKRQNIQEITTTCLSDEQKELVKELATRTQTLNEFFIQILNSTGTDFLADSIKILTEDINSTLEKISKTTGVEIRKTNPTIISDPACIVVRQKFDSKLPLERKIEVMLKSDESKLKSRMNDVLEELRNLNLTTRKYQLT